MGSEMLPAGLMNQRVTIQSPPTGEDALGQRIGTWSDLATVWAQALPLRGLEKQTADSTQTGAVVKFRLRYRSDITAAMRVTWRGVTYSIVGDPIDVDGARHTTELVCSSGVAP